MLIAWINRILYEIQVKVDIRGRFPITCRKGNIIMMSFKEDIMVISRYKLQPEDDPLFNEFMQNPSGPHSLRLQKILNLFRGCGELRYGLLVKTPYKEWVLVSIHKPGVDLEIHNNYVFSNLDDAEREIFRRRWEYHRNK